MCAIKLGAVSVLVPDYEVGLTFFAGGLGWHVLADIDQGRKRWVVVTPDPGGTAVVLARADGETQLAALGNQLGGRVGFFLHTDDFAGTAARIEAAGGTFAEAPRDEPYGRVAVWADPWGNAWDLIQPTQP